MTYRHEWKHEIDLCDAMVLRQRLRAITRPDPHAPGGRYLVRSLYFDTPEDTALRQKLDGVDRREKFRIRYYNGDVSFIRLEKKCKLRGVGSKESAPLTPRQVQAIVDGDLDWMPGSGVPLFQELYHRSRIQELRPKAIVDYTREPFVYPAGNVRVTLDYDIRTGLGCTGFLDAGRVTVPIPGGPILLEVKWDTFLPDVIRDAVQLEGRRSAAFSKYAACRVYG